MGRLRGWLGSDAQVPRLRRRLPRARNRRRNLSVGRSAPENRVHGCRVRLVGWFHGPTAAGFSSLEALSLSCLTTRGTTIMLTHLGTRFEIWTGQQSWFWRFSNGSRSGGSIGAAATETDAVRDACLAIEEMIGGRTGTTRPMGQDAKVRLPIDAPSEFHATMIGWNLSLTRLENYLAQVNCL